MAPLWSWMEKVLPSLDKLEPVHGDVDTVAALNSMHTVSWTLHWPDMTPVATTLIVGGVVSQN